MQKRNGSQLAAVMRDEKLYINAAEILLTLSRSPSLYSGRCYVPPFQHFHSKLIYYSFSVVIQEYMVLFSNSVHKLRDIFHWIKETWVSLTACLSVCVYTKKILTSKLKEDIVINHHLACKCTVREFIWWKNLNTIKSPISKWRP